MRVNSVIRLLVDRRGVWNFVSIRSCSRLCETSISAPLNSSSQSSPFAFKWLFSNNNNSSTVSGIHISSPSIQCRRTLCSSSGSKILLIKSEEQFNCSMKNVQDKSLPAVFYFTAVWCGPCKFISPVLEEQSKNYPDVTTYKIDIDQEGLCGILSKLYITSVPTFHFFQNGKKADEIVGADVERLKDTMEELYGKD